MKFHENILNGFQVIERTRNDHCKISKGNNSKQVLTRAMVLLVCTSSDDANISMKFHENILNCFQVIERTRFCDRQMDRQTIKAKTICLHTSQGWGRGGDIKYKNPSSSGSLDIMLTRFCYCPSKGRGHIAFGGDHPTLAIFRIE